VVIDLVSTYWLVANTSAGITGESNPLGLALYRTLGYGGMVAGKLVAFALMSSATLVLDRKFNSITWFRGVEKTLLLSLVAISSLAALINFGAFITATYNRGVAQSLSLSVNILSLILFLVLVYLPWRLIGFQGGLRLLVAIGGTLALISPLLYFKDLFVVVLTQVPVAIAAYAAAAYAVIAGLINVFDESRRGQIPPESE